MRIRINQHDVLKEKGPAIKRIIFLSPDSEAGVELSRHNRVEHICIRFFNDLNLTIKRFMNLWKNGFQPGFKDFLRSPDFQYFCRCHAGTLLLCISERDYYSCRRAFCHQGDGECPPGYLAQLISTAVRKTGERLPYLRFRSERLNCFYFTYFRYAP